MLSKQRGFSLIELMATVVIMGILAAVAIPSFQTWVSNSQIRNAAESISNGVQMARSEAVKNNGRARFVLCGLPSSSWEIRAASSTAAANATVSPACGTTVPAGEMRVQERSSQEGSRLVQVAANGGAAGVTTITFNSFGGVITPNADGSAPISQIDVCLTTPCPMPVPAPAARSNENTLRVTIGSGGNARMCDPALPSSNPRGC